ncbi:tail fiber domain-containing protein [Cronobacter sakazakii]|uniref:Phage tail protein n=2 Tax=Cronobacter malonaticus TaxID=413503 RepID=A0ABX5JTZ0_9ENTR|nr:tail fiber domain-containing protein [Cronobacter sakazakii]PUW99259.1 phage tail protein [Cronobacter malonaticus]ELY4344395.1 tail fiber domain-containing protein [Cronobacter sakazakii]ELY4568170.1 tail fiber domain-containing protein [Cronobacter sakazakii]ELY4732288.1 tail fiber domain-containing protein [Cronobacter sakazakii]
MTRMYADSKSMRGWLTALDAVTIEREDGTEVTVKPLMQIVNEHNANLEWYKENKEILDASAAGAKKSAESAAASAADAAGSSRQSAASASLASEKANAADASAAAAKSSETVVSEKADAAEGAKLAAQTAESNAGKQANAAAGSATQAQQYATNAKREADRAQTISNEINSTVDKFLQKDQNLADITNPGAARVSLGVERVTQGPTSTALGKSGGSRLFVFDNGTWGALNGSDAYIPLGVAQGGTGAKDVEEARANLGLGSTNSVEFNMIKGRSDIATSKVSDDAVRSNAIYTNIVGSDGTVKSQAELWCDSVNGVVSLVNRNPSGPRFFTIRSTGEVEPSGRIMSGYGAEFKHNGEVLTLRPSGDNQATYMLIRADDGSNVMLIGKPGGNDDTVLYNYKHGTNIYMQSSWGGCNKNWYGATVESRSGYLNSKTSASNANAHVYFINSDGRNRGVIYAQPIEVSQSIVIRSDNSATGAAGQYFLFNGDTGEARAAKFTATSDERAKFWIKPVTGALDKICQLKGVTYSMHTTIQNTVRNAGLIAQDVQKVLPEAVSVGQTGSTLDKNCFEVENPLTLDYNALSALYVEAFKEVKTEMASMKTEIEALRAEIAALKGETGTPSA